MTAADQYWQCQRYYPHDPRFNADNFRWMPTWLVNQALAAAKRADREHYHALERPIAQLAQMYYNSKTEAHKHLQRDSFEMYGPPKPIITITPNSAAVYFHLGTAGSLPPWAQIKEIGDQMQPLYRSGVIPEFPALVGPRAVLLCPVIHPEYISCDYAIVNKGQSMEMSIVTDVRSGEEYRIVIEQSERSVLTENEARFKLIKEAPEPGIPALPTVTRG